MAGQGRVDGPPSARGFQYQGSELETFAGATNWKTYFSSFISPYIGRHVLEVGAGLGANTGFLVSSRVEQWVCLEPDPALAEEIRLKIRAELLPRVCSVRTGTLEELAGPLVFDSILYLDVLEHIADDRAELRLAASRLTPGGYLLVLAPAHGFLFSAFDAAIGHHRRYNLAALRAAAPSGLEMVDWRMLDAAGFFASLANRWLLRLSTPSRRQVSLWDRCLVPASRFLDRMTFYRAGKTVLIVWRRS
jgi:SAM-dependent methyltransferase